MSSIADDIVDASGDFRAVAELAVTAAGAESLPPGHFYVVPYGGQLHRVDLTGDEHRDNPRRKAGHTVVRDVDSFASYYDKHAVDGVTEVYADGDKATVTAILDAHRGQGEEPGWRQHRLTLQLRDSEAWKAWKSRDNRFMSQEDFAEFLDDNRADIVSPSAAEMLEIAQTISGTSKVEWQASHRLADGQRRIGFVETNQAKAGQKGELAIPAEIQIGVPVFEGAGVRHAFTARFRHRIEGGQLRLMYKLDRPADVVTAAFDGVVAEVTEATGATVLRGTPA